MSKVDKEIDTLLAKLRAMHRAVVGEQEEKKKKTKGEDKFLALKSVILKGLGETCNLIDKADSKDTLGSFTDPKVVIARNQDIRAHLRQLEEDWGKMSDVYQKELGKRFSKVPEEEMKVRRQILQDLKKEISELKAIHQQGIVGGMGAAGGFQPITAQQLGQQPFVQGPNVDAHPAQLTEGQHLRIQQIRERQQQMESEYYGVIEEHVDRLNDFAKAMNEHIVKQGRQIDDLGERVEVVQAHLENSNKRLKNVVQKVRSSDKFCMDVMCILLMLGLVAVLFAAIKGTS